jgi:hypothetical protein
MTNKSSNGKKHGRAQVNILRKKSKLAHRNNKAHLSELRVVRHEKLEKAYQEALKAL